MKTGAPQLVDQDTLIQWAIKRFEYEGRINDDELQRLLEHYTKLERALSFHGELYALVHGDVKSRLFEFQGFFAARNNDPKRLLPFDITGKIIDQ